MRQVYESIDGQLFENAVVNQLSPYGDLSFYNKRNTAEIDLVFNKEIAFEVKLTGTVTDIHQVKKQAQKIGLARYYVVSKKYVETKDGGLVYPMFL